MGLEGSTECVHGENLFRAKRCNPELCQLIISSQREKENERESYSGRNRDEREKMTETEMRERERESERVKE